MLTSDAQIKQPLHEIVSIPLVEFILGDSIFSNKNRVTYKYMYERKNIILQAFLIDLSVYLVKNLCL